MKKIILFFLYFISISLLSAQESTILPDKACINCTNTQDSSAVIDIQSTDKGMLIPRMTTTQRTDIATPAKGLLVFDNTTNGFWFYDGTAWTELAGGDSDGGTSFWNAGTLSSELNTIYNNNSGGIALGTSLAFGHKFHVRSSDNKELAYFYNNHNTGAHTYAIRAQAANNTSGYKYGVRGVAHGSLGRSYGVYGDASSVGTGTYYGIYGKVSSTNTSGTHYSGYFDGGQVRIKGNLTQIDGNVGLGTTTPNPDAALDVSSTTKGVLIPRMTSDQRAAIDSPSKGLLVFDNETNSFQYYDGANWIDFSDLSPWDRNGGDISYDNGNVGIGTAAPNSAAALDISSTTKGMLIPRMTSAQRAAIDSPSKGLLVFDNETNSFQYYDGANWIDFSNLSLWTRNGDDIIYNNSGVGGVGIGTPSVSSDFKLQISNSIEPVSINIINTSDTILDPERADNFSPTGIRIRNTSRKDTFSPYARFGVFSEVSTRDLGYGIYGLASNFGTEGDWRPKYGVVGEARGDNGILYGIYGRVNGVPNPNAYAGYFDGKVRINDRLSVDSAATFNNNIDVFGRIKLLDNTDQQNASVGWQAGQNLTIGVENTFLGVAAGTSTTTANYNTYVGHNAGNVNTGHANAFFGRSTGNGVTGEHNVFLGYVAGSALNSSATKDKSIAIGSYAKVYTNAIAIGHEATANHSSSIAIGYDAVSTGSNKAIIGRTSITSIGGYKPWTTIADDRFNDKIKEDVPGLSFITKLRPITYHRKSKELAGFVKQGQATKRSRDREDEAQLAKDAKIKFTGFIAQEVEAAAKEIGYDFSGIDKPQNDKDHYGLRYASFVVPLVKAVQEQQEALTQKDKQITDLANRLEKLEQTMQQLLDPKTSDEGQIGILNKRAYLEQNQPNPFNGQTEIHYFVPTSAQKAQLQVTTIDGKIVHTFPLKSGDSFITLDANQLPTGSYIYSLLVDGQLIESRQMVLMK